MLNNNAAAQPPISIFWERLDNLRGPAPIGQFGPPIRIKPFCTYWLGPNNAACAPAYEPTVTWLEV